MMFCKLGHRSWNWV